MKNICFILISLCISLSSFAQTDAQHLKFKGVPIDGTLAAYVSKMKAAGFSDLGIKDGTAVLQGDFAGFKGCIIGVSTLNDQCSKYNRCYISGMRQLVQT